MSFVQTGPCVWVTNLSSGRKVSSLQEGGAPSRRVVVPASQRASSDEELAQLRQIQSTGNAMTRERGCGCEAFGATLQMSAGSQFPTQRLQVPSRTYWTLPRRKIKHVQTHAFMPYCGDSQLGDEILSGVRVSQSPLSITSMSPKSRKL